MWLASLRRSFFSKSPSCQTKPNRPQWRRIVPALEHLENRIVPSNAFTIAAGDTAGLIAAINSANNDSKSSITGDTITLTSSSTSPYNFGSVNNTTNGANVLPVVTAVGLTIQGNGSILNAGANGRLFDVASGASVTLVNMTLTGGKVSGTSAKGGAIYNSGNLNMTSVVVNGNQAVGSNARGGGLYLSGGTVNVSKGTISGQASGVAGALGGGTGGSVQGGGIYANNTILTLTNVRVSGTLLAGKGGSGAKTSGKWNGGTGGDAQGGGIFSLNTTLTVSGGVVFGDAQPGNGGSGAAGTVGHPAGGAGGTAGLGQGGGIFIQGNSLTLSNAASVSANVGGNQGGAGGAGYKTSKGAYVVGGIGGAGGAGNNAAGGGVFATNAALTIESGATIEGNSARAAGGGRGGQGKTSGQGGSGGTGLGGGIFAQGGSVSITGTSTAIEFNSVSGGGGGEFATTSGKLLGGGGAGGNAYGGGLYALGNSVTLSNGVSIESNIVSAGMGGSGDSGTRGSSSTPGGNGGNGGEGGTAVGGGAYLGGAGDSLQINSGLPSAANVSIIGNMVTGGKGGGGGSGGIGAPGGNGGNAANGGFAEGGGLVVNGSGATTVNVNNAVIQFNQVTGGNGGTGGSGGSGSLGSGAGGAGGLGAAGALALGGGMYVNEGALTLTNTLIGANFLSGGQGGVGGGGGKAKGAAVGATKTNNGGGTGGNGNAGGQGAAALGGGLYVNASTVTLNTVNVTSNELLGGSGGTGGFGGAAGFALNLSSGVANLHGRPGGNGGNGANGAAGQGGGVFATGASTLTALNTAISGNSVVAGQGGFGGGGASGAGEILTAGKGGDGGNGANGGMGQGGGVYANSGSLTLVNSTVASNSVNGNRGGWGGNGRVGQNGGSVGGNGGAGGSAGNASAIRGGGVFATASTVKLVNATVANNNLLDGSGGKGGNGGNGGLGKGGTALGAGATGHYGAGGNAGNGGNAASGQGGGLYVGSGSLNLLNATVAYNALNPGTPGPAGTPGQGIIFHTGTGKSIQVSPNGKPGSSGNTAGTDQGGGLYVGSSVVTPSLENTILALNTAATDADVTGTFSSSDDDFIGDGTGSNLSNGVNGDSVGTTGSPLDPKLGTLANNIGPTQTILPTMTSPTLGKGDPNAASAIATAEGLASATDQRGLPRLFNGAIDIGATELQVDFNGTPSVTTVQAGGTITYTLTVTNGESTAINATLTDLVPTNTSYVAGSASGTGWTITEPSASNGNQLTATATLNASTVATLTFSVTVASTASNTTITDIGNLSWTGTNTSGTLSVPMNTTVTGGVSSTTTSLASSANPAVYGQQVTFTATVSNSSSSKPTGEVIFKDGSNILGMGSLSNGVASITTISPLSVGSHNITASYCGDTNDYGSTSTVLSQVVNRDSTTTNLILVPNPSLYGQPVTFTATVSPVSPGAGTPTGTVTFYDGSTTNLGTVTLSGGVATLTPTTTLPVGINNITAVYSGDANDLGSTSTVYKQQVDYHFGAFLAPLSNHLHFEVNRTIPIKFTLSDYAGNAITSLSAVQSLLIQPLDANGNPVGCPIKPASTNNQGLQYTGGAYQFNWQTKGLAAGSYEIVVTLAGGTSHTIKITLTANGKSAGLTSGSSGGMATAGALLGGEVDLYVDNSNGALTSDELARIQDAVNAVEKTIAPYGVTIVETSDSTQANTTLNMNMTSSLGGVAQGVLGATTDDDQVTMIQGWNWYAGSDPTLIASGQYDFETAVMHELGHVLGLGHSSNSSSVMYGTLATGTVRRLLVAADLNVPDDGAGSDALHAVSAAPVSGTSHVSSTTAPGSASVSSSGRPLSIVDQVLADIALALSDAWITCRSEMSYVLALRQQFDALALQSFDALLSFETSAMGMSPDNLMRVLLGGNPSSNGV